MLFLERIAEERIRDAIERGEFDNLPGAGKPLRLDGDRLVPGDLRIAYKILKDAGFLPPELELRKEILTLKDLLASVDDDDERLRLTREINHKVLQLNLLWKRSFGLEDRQFYACRVRQKLENGSGR